MKKRLFVLLSLLMISLLLPSCSGDISTPFHQEDAPVVDTEPLESVETALTELEKGGSLVLNQVGAETEIALSDFSLEDGIFIEIVEDSKSISRDSKAYNSEKLFKRQDGSFIPIPGQQGNLSFSGKDIGLKETGKIIIHRLLNLDDDFEIRAKEPQHLWHSTEFIAEEFYYVSFLDPRFSSLDPSEIVFVTSGVGHQGVSILQQGMMDKRADGVYDFSGKWFTGFAVNMFKSMVADSDDSIKLYIQNPIHPDSTPKALNNEINVILVDEQAAGNYNVVVSFSGDNASEVIKKIATSYNAIQFQPRYTDGNFRANYFYPEFDLENKTIIYHIGSVDKAFLFNLYYDEETGFQPGTATVVLEEDTSGFEPNDATGLGEVVITAPSKGIVTWYYKAETDVEVETVRGDFHRVYCMSVSENSMGTGGFNEQMTLKGFGFFIFEYKGSGTDVPMVTIRRADKKGLDCSAVAWDYDTEDYVCIDDDCEHCINQGSKQHYSRFFIEHNKNEIFHGERYWTLKSYGDYGRISWSFPHSVRCSENSSIRVETYGGDGRFPAPPRVIAANTNNRSQIVKLYLQKIILSEHKIVVDIAINDPEIWFYNVEMYAYPIVEPEQQTSDFLKFEGTFPAQRAFGQIDREGISARYVNGDSESNVTNSVVWTNSVGDAPTWGNAIIHKQGNEWEIDKAVLRATYNSAINGSISYTIDLGPLRGQYAPNPNAHDDDPNTDDAVIVFPNEYGSFVTLDISDKFSDVKAPVSDTLDGGYLIEGIEAGNYVWAVLSYADYVNDVASDINGLLAYANDLGAQIGDTEDAPTFGDFKNDKTVVFCLTVTGTGATGHEYVVIAGKLENAINPAVGIRKSDFEDGYDVFFFKTVAP